MLDPILKKQYQIIEDSRFLCEESDIVPYFEDNYDIFDCGQGYYQDEAEAIVYIDETFYQVNIKASITSAKQDRGDRLYWVDELDSVVYTKIDTPTLKESTVVSMKILKEDLQKIKLLFEKYKITYEILT